jgi:DNA primase
MDTGLGFVNKGDRRQDALRARVIFPIFDPGGKAIAVGGRILPPPYGSASRPDGRIEAKYKNSPETSIYSKRRTLYALNWAKDDVIKSDEIIVCEGYTDVIAFFMAGMPRAVATCGTALGEDHFKTMRNFAKRIVLAYDADKAGQSAAASVYQWERQHEVDVFVAHLPKGQDPAELAQHDPEALRKSVVDAVPFLRFRLDRVLESANLATAEGRGRAAEHAMDVLAEHPSELVRDQYIMQVASTLRLEESLLRPRVAELARNPKPRTTNEPPPIAVSQPRAARLPMPRPGLEALRLRVHFPNDVKDRLIAAYFVNDVQREIFEGLSTDHSLSEVIDELDRRGEEEAAHVLSQLAVDELDREYTVEDVTAVVSQLIRSAVNVELKNVARDLNDGNLAPDVADATVRDVKERLVLLEGASGTLAENELREWLLERTASRSS